MIALDGATGRGNHTGVAGGGPWRKHFHAAAGFVRPGDRDAGEVVCANDGIRVLPDTIQYLHERATEQMRWLETPSTSEVNLTVVSVVARQRRTAACANHVWQTYLKNKPGVVGADHPADGRAPISHFRHLATKSTVQSRWPRAKNHPQSATASELVAHSSR